jgi:hypothetical protein
MLFAAFITSASKSLTGIIMGAVTIEEETPGQSIKTQTKKRGERAS